MKKHIEKFKKIHPLTAKNMSDDEIEILGDKIDKIHNDETVRKFKDVFDDGKGNKYLIYSKNGEDEAIQL